LLKKIFKNKFGSVISFTYLCILIKNIYIMANYLDGMEGGKHNSDNTEVSISPKSFKVSLTFEAITGKNPLEVAKMIAKWCEDANTFTYDVVNEETGEKFTVDLSEEDADAVLSNKD